MKKTLSPTAVIGTLAHTVRHPRRSVGEAVTLAKGVAAHLTAGREPQDAGAGSGPVAEAPLASPAAPSKVHGDKLALDAEPGPASPEPTEPSGDGHAAPEPAPPADETEPAEPHPAVFTEPSAPLGGDADELLDEADGDDDLDIASPVEEPGDEPLLDPSTAKSIRSESDVLRKAADPEKG